MITINDIVTTSYSSGPYRVEAVKFWPALVREFTWIVRDYQTFSLICSFLKDPASKLPSYLNRIRVEGTRFFTDQGDEIIVLDKASGQASFFESIECIPEWMPYQWQPGVDYEVGVGDPGWSGSGLHIDNKYWNLFHCESCRVDFNPSYRPEGFGERLVPCLNCGRYTDPLIFRKRRALNEKKLSLTTTDTAS